MVPRISSRAAMRSSQTIKRDPFDSSRTREYCIVSEIATA